MFQLGIHPHRGNLGRKIGDFLRDVDVLYYCIKFAAVPAERVLVIGGVCGKSFCDKAFGRYCRLEPLA
jgi:hypothetical protein